MNTRVFFDSLAFMYVTDPDFQLIANSAGVDWFRVPNSESTKIVQKYLALRAEKPHVVCANELRQDLRFLEMSELDFKTIPLDETVLAYELKNALKLESYRTLGERLLKSPEMGQHLVSEFLPTVASPVRAALADQLIPFEIGQHLARVEKNEAEISIPGFETLSSVIGGFNPGRVLMLMAETGFGKTNLGLNFAIRAATQMVVGYVNMEMIDADMVKRMTVIGTGTTYENYKRGKIDQDALKTLCSAISSRLYVTDGRSLSLAAIEAWSRLKAKEGMKLLIVDYDQKIQLSSSRDTPEWKAVQLAIERIEDLAKEMNFCCIVFAQVNRDGEISSSHRSKFAASTVLSFENDPNEGPVIIARKNRHGIKDEGVSVTYVKENSQIAEKLKVHLPQDRLAQPKTRTVKVRKNVPNWGAM